MGNYQHKLSTHGVLTHPPLPPQRDHAQTNLVSQSRPTSPRRRLPQSAKIYSAMESSTPLPLPPRQASPASCARHPGRSTDYETRREIGSSRQTTPLKHKRRPIAGSAHQEHRLPTSNVSRRSPVRIPLPDVNTKAQTLWPNEKGIFITLEGGEGVGKSTQARLLAQALQSAGIACVLTREPGGTATGEQLRQVIVNAQLTPREELSLLLAARSQHISQVIEPALSHGFWVICDRFVDSSRIYQGLVPALAIDPNAYTAPNEPVTDTLSFMDSPTEEAASPERSCPLPHCDALSAGEQGQDEKEVLSTPPQRRLCPRQAQKTWRWIDQWHGYARITLQPDMTIVLHSVVDESLQRRRNRPELCNKFDQQDPTIHQHIHAGFRALAQVFAKRCQVIGAKGSIAQVHRKIVNQVHRRFLRKVCAIHDLGVTAPRSPLAASTTSSSAASELNNGHASGLYGEGSQ